MDSVAIENRIFVSALTPNHDSKSNPNSNLAQLISSQPGVLWGARDKGLQQVVLVEHTPEKSAPGRWTTPKSVFFFFFFRLGRLATFLFSQGTAKRFS